MIRAALLLTLVVCTAGLRAHPEIEQALVALNARIAASPGDGELYLERGFWQDG